LGAADAARGRESARPRRRESGPSKARCCRYAYNRSSDIGGRRATSRRHLALYCSPTVYTVDIFSQIQSSQTKVKANIVRHIAGLRFQSLISLARFHNKLAKYTPHTYNPHPRSAHSVTVVDLMPQVDAAFIHSTSHRLPHHCHKSKRAQHHHLILACAQLHMQRRARSPLLHNAHTRTHAYAYPRTA
jgi:hypothetical protein